jgi:iron complex transport system substrate-binding protein
MMQCPSEEKMPKFEWMRMLLAFLALLPAANAAAISVQDDAGRTVTLAQPARRIVTTAPHITEMVFAAGGGPRIVGATSYSDHPVQARSIPKVGDDRQLDVERVLALRPDLLIVWSGGNPARQIEQLQRLGIPVYFSDPHRLSDVPAGIERIGVLLGTESDASAAAAELRRKLRGLAVQYGRRPVLGVFYQVSSRPLYTLNGRHIVSDALRLCGGRNIFADLRVTAPSVSAEAVLQKNPEVILNASVEDGSLELWRRYPTLEATRRGNLFDLNPDLLNRPGSPRMIDGVASMCETIEQARRNMRKR